MPSMIASAENVGAWKPPYNPKRGAMMEDTQFPNCKQYSKAEIIDKASETSLVLGEMRRYASPPLARTIIIDYYYYQRRAFLERQCEREPERECVCACVRVREKERASRRAPAWPLRHACHGVGCVFGERETRGREDETAPCLRTLSRLCYPAWRTSHVGQTRQVLRSCMVT